jgi:hypothetical protein
MSLKTVRISAFSLALALLGITTGRSVVFHASTAATISQPANNTNGPGGGDPSPECPTCVVRAL